jgi:hypothetical protein
MNWDILLVELVELGFGDALSLAQTFGIIGTMVLTLYFSKRQIQSMSIDQQTKVLNDLDEKVRKMAELIIENPSMQKVIYKLEKPSEEIAFASGFSAIKNPVIRNSRFYLVGWLFCWHDVTAFKHRRLICCVVHNNDPIIK